MGTDHETYLSAFNHTPQAYAWISGSHENARRPRRIAYSPRKGARAARRLTRTAGKFSFSRASRLEGPNAFLSVFAYKCSAAGAYVQVYAKPNGRADSRLGIAVTKRFVPQATARNYCKRLAREAFRVERAALGGVDLVVRVRGPVSSAAAVTARAEIIDLMHRARRQCLDRANALPQC